MKQLSKIDPINDHKNDLFVFIFIQTPFCGTCKLARKMLETIEHTWEEDLFYDMNASLYPGFMKEHQIESVPCLLIMRKNKVVQKIYAFHSVSYLYEFLLPYKEK